MEFTERLHQALIDFEAAFCCEDPPVDTMLEIRELMDQCSEELKKRIRIK